MPIEKFSTIKPAPGQGKRVMKAKLLTALGATGPDRPYTANPEHILESKILLQNTFNPNPVTPPIPPPPTTNGLLTGLISYWHLAEVNPPDIQDGNTLALAGGTINAAGGLFANGPFIGFSGGLNNGLIVNPAPANLKLGTGASFGFSIWFHSNTVQTNIFAAIAGQFNFTIVGSSWFLYVNSGNITLQGYCTDGTTQALAITPNPGTGTPWQHLAVGYDASIKKLYAQFNGGARLTLATTADLNSSTAIFGICASAGGNDENLTGSVNESGFWNRVLSTTDVVNLYNAGAGLPFSSFQT